MNVTVAANTNGINEPYMLRGWSGLRGGYGLGHGLGWEIVSL